MKKTARKRATKSNRKVKQTKQKPSKWKNNLLAIAIAIVLTAFIFYGVYTFYEYPDNNKYCPIENNYKFINSSDECIANDGLWNPNQVRYAEEKSIPNGYCDLSTKCSEKYNTDNNIYKKNVFMIAVVLGLIALIGGIFVSYRSVSGGLMGGGILTLIVGILQYWSELGDTLRFITLGIVLAILIYVGVKKLRD